MKYSMPGSLMLVIFSFIFSLQSFTQQPGLLTYPFSQLVIRNDWAAPIVWKYKPFKEIVETETIIAPPAMNEDWNAWYKNMKNYQAFLRSNLNDTDAVYLEVTVKKNSNVRLTYKRVLNSIRLLPGDKIVFEGLAKNDTGLSKFTVGLIFIKKGEELSHAIANHKRLIPLL